MSSKKLRVDFADIDGGTYESAGDQRLIGCIEVSARSQFKVSALKTVGMAAAQAQSDFGTTDLENEQRILDRDAGREIEVELRTGLCHANDIGVIGNFPRAGFSAFCQARRRPQGGSAGIDLNDPAEQGFNQIERMAAIDRQQVGALRSLVEDLVRVGHFKSEADAGSDNLRVEQPPDLS